MGNLINLSDIPVKLNLFDYFDKFENTEAGANAKSELDKSVDKENKRRIISWIFLIILSLLTIVTFFIPIILLVVGGMSVSSVYKKNIGKAQEKFSTALNEYSQLISKKLINEQFEGSKILSFEDQTIIYNNSTLVYLSVITGDFVIYDNVNIKEVSRERVHTGSTTKSTSVTNGRSRDTVGTAVGLNPFESRKINAVTSTNSNSVDNYEWHFDILTDFMSYPKVSFVTPDNDYFENEIGMAYGILKP